MEAVKYRRLGEVLLELGMIEEDLLKHALKLQKMSGERLGVILVRQGMLTEQQLLQALKIQLEVPIIDLSKEPPDPKMSMVLPKSIAQRHEVVPVRKEEGSLYLAMKDPMDFIAVEEVKAATRLRVIPMLADCEGVNRALQELYGREGVAKAIEEMEKSQTQRLSAYKEEDSSNAPTIRLVNSLFERAAIEHASDIHLEPRENELAVRMRIDGVLHSILNVPANLQCSVISRIKVIGGMNTTEHRIPQDGRASLSFQDQTIDLRISTLPVVYGEKVVIRLLNQSQSLLNYQGIGLFGSDLEKYKILLKRRSGVVIMAGPTGSGKTSTLYTMIQELNQEGVNLVTLEDPVEYHIKGINQVPINEKVGMTFTGGLRAILRQDPDIIAVGEIRDGETAGIAMQAALTGHLVLSTIHTNDAVSTIDRLKDIGVEPYLIAGAINGIISQRLVRRICINCKESYEPGKEEREILGIDSKEQVTFYRGKGCPHCFHTGYRGRIGVFEILVMNERLRYGIMEGKSRKELLEALKEPGYVSIRENCKRLVLGGVTTVDEARNTIDSMESQGVPCNS
jgi:type IV pilus assembly protein PilB